MDRAFRILFIGNSYTYFHQMPERIFSEIARSAGYAFDVSSVTRGGWYLDRHASPEDEVGATVDRLLREESFDYVVLQEQSLCPVLYPDRFEGGARTLLKRIREIGATTVLYATWGRKPGSPSLEKHGMSSGEMTDRLADAYRALGRAEGVPVAHVGLAFREILDAHGNAIELYHTDLTHPSPVGSTLAALTLLLRITGADPASITYRGELSEETFSALLSAAQNAVCADHNDTV